MDKSKLYPVLLAEPIQDYDQNKSFFYIFNSRNNRGYKLDGFAANLCNRFDGIKSLEQVIREFETDMELQSDYFKEEIDALLADLQNNSLIEFNQAPQILKEG